MPSKKQPVLRTSVRIQLRAKARLAQEAESKTQSQSDVADAEIGDSSAIALDTPSHRENMQKRKAMNTSSKAATKRKERTSTENKKRKATKISKATKETSDELDSCDDSCDPDDSVKEEFDIEYRVPVSRKRKRARRISTKRAAKVKASDPRTGTPSEDMERGSNTSSQRESLSPDVDVIPPSLDVPIWTLDQWIQYTLSGMIHAFMAGREHYDTPLATVIYWMPRVAPIDSAASLMSSDPMRFWTIPVKDIDQPWERASVTLHLRTDQVAHWLHISMQDLVGFLTLCSIREMTALNMYLNFRLRLMNTMNAMPSCYNWIYAKTVPQPGEYTYGLLLKLRSVDDEQQRLLTVALHASIETRRNLFDLAAVPRNAPVAFVTKTHNAIVDYHHKAWSLYRAVTSPSLEWRADTVYPDFDDRRSVHRWFRVEVPAMEVLTIDQVRDVIEADMRFRTIVEKDRSDYIAGNLMQDELHCSLHDTRMLFPHQLPFEYQEQKEDSVEYHSSIDEYVSTQIRIRPDLRKESWWQDELQDIQQWDHVQGAHETLQMEQNFQSMQSHFEYDRQEQEQDEEDEEEGEQEDEQETEPDEGYEAEEEEQQSDRDQDQDQDME